MTTQYSFCIIKNISCLLVIAITLSVKSLFAQVSNIDSTEHIRLNQVGFYPNAPKTAIVLTSKENNTFYVETVNKKKVFKGTLMQSVKPDFAGNTTSIADFSAFNQPGRYILQVPGAGHSWPFEIKKSVHLSIADASIKAYYFMRASIPLKEKYAGKWQRAEGHPDTVVLIHPSAASDTRLAGTVISSPGGWYDAGDYNKYIVNSGISTSTLLSLYEDFPDYMKTVKLNIPESGNKIPDVLNEALWNLRWMLTMQDPNDGGVYHKLTNAAFDKFIMPDKCTTPRYVVQKGTAATLDFAAVMAQASRIFRNYPKELPGLADSCLKQADNAWAWAVKNRDVAYNQDAMNKKYSPPITTGAYGDRNFEDEFIWAASELFVTTNDARYLQSVDLMPDKNMSLPTWGQVRLLGYYSLIKHGSSFAANAPKEILELKSRLTAFADDMVSGANETAYQIVMDKSIRNFGWGSNSVAGNEGVALIQAWQLTHKPKYLRYALANLDYILGRNGTGYSFVTGYGSRSPMHPHHRPSAADGVVDPIPGLLVGGPNPGMQDGIKVPSIVPDEAYIDDERAYAVNEIAINWNAPLAYLSNAMEALQNELGKADLKGR